MKEDAAAKELEDLLRDALNTGVEPARGATPLVQLKTVPLQVQHIPMKRAAAAPAPAPAPKPVAITEASPESIPSLADKLAPESIRPQAAKTKERSRSSGLALVAIGMFAIMAAGGAVWLNREHRATQLATATPVQAPDNAPSEGAVGISVAPRPTTPAAAAAPTEAPKVDENKAVAATPTPAAPPVVTAVTPAPAKPEVKEASNAAKPSEKEPKAEAKPRHSSSGAKASGEKPEKPEKPEKTATAEKKEAAPAPPPPAPAAAGGSVDALLQQQLKGAIP